MWYEKYRFWLLSRVAFMIRRFFDVGGDFLLRSRSGNFLKYWKAFLWLRQHFSWSWWNFLRSESHFLRLRWDFLSLSGVLFLIFSNTFRQDKDRTFYTFRSRSHSLSKIKISTRSFLVIRPKSDPSLFTKPQPRENTSSKPTSR